MPDSGVTTVIVGGTVRSMDASGREHEALSFRDGAIAAVGDRAAVLGDAGTSATVVDVEGATVLPGFVDAHHHVIISALYGGAARLDGSGVRDIPALQAALAAAAEDLPAGRWLVAMGWDETRLRERRPPTRADLDDAVPGRPLFALHHTCHRALANGAALRLAGIDARTPEPPGGAIVRGGGGEPTGLLIERGMSRVEALARPDLARHDAAGILDRVAAHYRALVRAGITRVVDTAVPVDLMTLYREAARRGDVLVPTHVCPVSTTGYLEEPWDALDGPTTGVEDGPLTIGPVKLVFDGAPGCSMCLGWWQSIASAMRALGLAIRMGSADPIRTMLSVEPRLGRDVRSGIAIYGRDDAERVVRGVVERGFSVATHAIGNLAIDVALSAYEAVGSRVGAAGCPRIEHAAFLDRENVRRLAGGGVAAVVQPGMLAMHMYSTAVEVPGLPFFPLRWLLDAGVLVAGSSDFPVDGFDPLAGIHAAIRRTNARGAVVNEDQRISLDEALRMYTRSAAEIVGCLDRTGTLEVGKRADLVVVDGLGETAEGARVRATYVGGQELSAR